MKDPVLYFMFLGYGLFCFVMGSLLGQINEAQHHNRMEITRLQQEMDAAKRERMLRETFSE